MSAVFPDAQAGARDQEAPGLRVQAAATVICASFMAMVDPDSSVRFLDPIQGDMVSADVGR